MYRGEKVDKLNFKTGSEALLLDACARCCIHVFLSVYTELTRVESRARLCLVGSKQPLSPLIHCWLLSGCRFPLSLPTRSCQRWTQTRAPCQRKASQQHFYWKRLAVFIHLLYHTSYSNSALKRQSCVSQITGDGFCLDPGSYTWL